MFTWGLLHVNSVQNWLVKKATTVLSQNLNTKVEVNHVDFTLFNKILFKGVLVEDRNKDTLLYAGILKVNLTDWFFLNNKINISHAGLIDAVINMNRTDSIWNYQFLIDYFSVPKSAKPSNKNNIALDLKELELNNIRFNYKDKWVGQNMTGTLKKLDLLADVIDLNKKIVAINNISIVEPLFSINDYTGNRPIPNQIIKLLSKGLNEEKGKEITTGWQLSAKTISIKDGTFINEQATERLAFTHHFDGQHFQFGKINADIKNVNLANDSLTNEISLSTIEKSGFEVKKLQSRMLVTSEMMEFNDLEIITPKSRLGNYYSMRFKDFNADMSRFMQRVKLEGHFADSKIHSDDIAYFAPELKPWNRLFTFSGKAKGTIDNLSATKMILKSGNTTVDGDITLKGLPDIWTTFIDFKSNNSSTNYNDLVILVPTLKTVGQSQLRQLGNIRFKGNFTGFLNDFVTYGNVSTNLGNLNADLNMKLPTGKTPTYSGKISSNGFQLGKLLNKYQLGKISLDGKVKGSGFNSKDLNTSFDGKIHLLEFANYSYQNITAKGNFVKNLFTGQLDIDDPNLKIENLNGAISLAGEKTSFNFDAFLKYANLQKLNLTKDEFNFSGRLKFDFVGSNIDNFLGSAKVFDANLLQGSKRLSFDSLAIYSEQYEENKILRFQSNEVEGNLTGKFQILELPDAFKVFLNRYYPAYVPKSTRNISDQDFTFRIKTNQVDDYIHLLDKKLSGFNNSEFSGNLKLAKNELNITASVPEFSYDGRIFQNISLTGKGNLEELKTEVTVFNIILTDSIQLPKTKLVFTSKNDFTDLQLTTSASNTLSEAQLNAQVQTLTDGVKINFSPSSFIFNDKKWNLAKNGHLTLRRNLIEAEDVKFSSGNQEIVINTELDELLDHTNIVANLKKVIINDFVPFILTDPRLEGELTGTLKLIDPFGKQLIEYDAYVDDFRFENKAIGKLNVKGNVNLTSGLIKLKADANGELFKFNIDGSYNYKDTTQSQMDIAFIAEKFDISLLDKYLGDVFSNMTGVVQSNLKLSGGNDHRYITGSVTIPKGSLVVKYTQCKYSFNNEIIQFNPDEIDLGTLRLIDTLNNTGTASGKMHHNFFNDFSFDNLRFETGKMLLLNTTKKDNSQFYGKVIGQAFMKLTGPITDMKIDITGQPSSVDSSHIYIPTGSSKEIGKIDYIQFIEYGTKMEDEFKSRRETNFFLNMNLAANPACQIDVILDEALGDIIKGKGTGQLNIQVGTREPLTMRGHFDIKEGEYTFNFQTFLKKYFTIKQGSIVWNGDPYLARINIDAEYLAKNIDLRSISSSFKQKSDITIVSHLTGVLNKPEVSFDFVLPENVERDFIAMKKLEDIKNDKNEMLKQVASLLLLNTFISENEGFLNSDNTLALAANSIGQLLSSALTSTFSKFLQKALNDNTITSYFDVNSSLDLRNSTSQLQGAVKLGITKSYFNNKLIVSLGGNLDYNNPYLATSNLLLTPDFTAEWLLSKDGKLRIVGFRRTNLDFTLGQRNRQGISLSYRSDFDKFSELFAPNEEKRKIRLAKKGMD